MKSLKYLAGKAADHAVGVIVTASGSALVVYLTPVWEYIKIGWAWLATPIQVPVGFMFIMAILVGLIAIGLIRELIIRNSTPELPEWMSYREDEFEGAVWRWSYSSSGQVVELAPFCKSCDCMLEIRTFGLGSPLEMYCVDCSYSYSAFSMNVSPDYARSIIARLIDRNRRRNFNRLNAGG